VLQQMRSAAKWIWIFIVVAFVGGFLFVDTSGLLGRDRVTTTSIVATVNGVDIPYLTWVNLSNALAQQREQYSGRGLNLDERKEIEDQAFDQLVTDILLQQEYDKRGIRVSDEEVLAQARSNPPEALRSDPTLQTDGVFDLEKYQRLLASSQARQQGLLLQLESFYRTEIPRSKLYAQLLNGVYVSDEKLWASYQDQNDSAQVSFVKFDPAGVPDSTVTVTEVEARRYYEDNKDRFERPGRAALSLLVIPRTITEADSQWTLAKTSRLRDEIEGGARFEDIAARESQDESNATSGGSLGWRGKGVLDPAFEKAAFALRVGEVSQPVLSGFGYHLIKVDQKQGDSINVRHILIRMAQSDSNALMTDRKADSLARIGAASTEPTRFDSAAIMLGLAPQHVEAYEGQPLFTVVGMAPGVSAWAFTGVQAGETSDLFDTDEAYFLARLDTLHESGIAPYEEVQTGIIELLRQRKKAEALASSTRTFADRARASTLEGAAQESNLTVERSNLFSRSTFVPNLGRLNAAIGAAFALPVGAISNPIATDDGVFVIRVDRRIEASREAFEAQKEVQRSTALNVLQQARVRDFMEGLRANADIKDRRKALSAAARAQSVAQ